ncbi:FkbM family methyltransferase [Paraconexibacter sp.]|uniref:FkbM family methyltransferase n=1 Tax=Paraconexibacter sp. TaxID=2949640 RepID=UPI0035642CD2
MPPATFASQFFRRLLEAVHDHDHDVTDAALLAVSAPRRAQARLASALPRAAARRGWGRRRFELDSAASRLANVAAGLPGLERTYALLQDQASRDLLVELFLFRVLGSQHVRSPVAFTDYARARAGLEVVERDVAVVPDPHTPRLSRYRVTGPGGAAITICSAEPELASVYALGQYHHPEVHAEPGDVVLDGGAGWGDTALYFADAVGATGRVISLEISPVNAEVIAANTAANPDLPDVIEVVPFALWDRSGETLHFSEAGQASVLGSGDASGTAVETRTVDALVADLGIERLGFVKLDIEGAEPQALRGMEQTLRRDRPKLAIALYHDPMHFIDLPAAIDDLGLGYRFFLGQGAPGTPETILFAAA